MSELTPIPAEQRRAYYDALLVGRAEAARLGYPLPDDRIFGEFWAAIRSAYTPLIEAAARADERAKVAEEIAEALLAVDPIEWALAGQNAGEDAAAIARQHA